MTNITISQGNTPSRIQAEGPRDTPEEELQNALALHLGVDVSELIGPYYYYRIGLVATWGCSVLI